MNNGIPGQIVDGLRQYLVDRLPPGRFLQAVLENDLMGAFSRVDPTNRAALQAICLFVWNETPDEAWGSREKVAAWLEKRKLEA